MKLKHAGGRPPKFNEPRRTITITLPERTLHQLTLVEKDRAKAIAKVTDTVAGPGSAAGKLVDVIEVAPGRSVILMGHSAYLDRIPWLRQVEIAPARYLISVASGTPIESLEVAIGDLLEEVPASETHERELLQNLKQCVVSSRRGRKVTKEEILFVDSGV